MGKTLSNAGGAVLVKTCDERSSAKRKYKEKKKKKVKKKKKSKYIEKLSKRTFFCFSLSPLLFSPYHFPSRL